MDNQSALPTDTDLAQFVIAREMVGVQAAIMKVAGFPPAYVAAEMIAQAVLIVAPFVTIDQAREAACEFFKNFAEGLRLKAAEAPQTAPQSLPDGVLQFVRKAAHNGELPPSAG
jgi:hypothetical protein